MNNDEEGARLTRMEENRERIAKHRADVGGSPAPRERLAELREFLMERIDGSEETRAWDSKLTRFIEAIDALPSEITPPIVAHSKTEYKRLKEQGANVLPPASPAATPRTDAIERTVVFWQLVEFAKQLERELAEQTRLRQMADHERDGMLEKLVAANDRWQQEWDARKAAESQLAALQSAQSATAAMDQDWPEDFAHENGRYECACAYCGLKFLGHKRRVVCRICAAPQAAPVEETALLIEINERMGKVDTEVAVRALGNNLLTRLYNHVRDMKGGERG